MNRLYEAVEKCFSNETILNDIEQNLRKELLAAKARYHRIKDYPETASYYMNHLTTDFSKIKKDDVVCFTLIFENHEEIFLPKNAVADWLFDGVNDAVPEDGNIYDNNFNFIRKELAFKTGFMKLKLPILKHLYTRDGISNGAVDPDAIDRIIKTMDISDIRLKLKEGFSYNSPSEVILLTPYTAGTKQEPTFSENQLIYNNWFQHVSYDSDYLVIEWLISE